MTSPFVTLRKFHDATGAQLARTCLEAAGVECFVAEEHIAYMTELDHTPIGGVKLKVRESDRARALEILATPARLIR